MNPKPPKDFEQLDLDAALTKLMREHALGIERLTEAQFVQALKQALASGDFETQVVCNPVIKEPLPWNGEFKPSDASFQVTHTQSVTYEPFRRVTELEARITELEQQLAAATEQARVAAIRKPVL